MDDHGQGAVLVDDGQDLKAADLKEATGLSYRQINDWDSKGLLPESRDKDGAWRRFSPATLFVLMVLTEIRRRFGVPLKSLGWIKSFMLQEGANHLRAAQEKIALEGTGVYILTDLETSFLMETDVEIGNLMRMGTYGGDHAASYILIKVNPLVNRLLRCLYEPTQVGAHSLAYRLANTSDEGSEQ